MRIFGTEDRPCDVQIGMLNEIRPLISFNRAGISSIRIIPNVIFGAGVLIRSIPSSIPVL